MILVYLILSSHMIATLNSNFVGYFPTNNENLETSAEFNLLDEMNKNINEKINEKNFLNIFNIFANTYTILKENHIEQGQKKLVYSLLDKLSNKLFEYICIKNVPIIKQKNQVLHTLFESLEAIGNKETKTKQTSFSFKWGR
jgi:hypothetical protein